MAFGWQLGDAGQDFLGHCAPHFLPGQGVQLSLEKAKSHASTFRQKASTNSSLHSTHNCVAHFHSGQWIVDASVVAIVEITAAFVVVDNTGRERKEGEIHLRLCESMWGGLARCRDLTPDGRLLSRSDGWPEDWPLG